MFVFKLLFLNNFFLLVLLLLLNLRVVEQVLRKVVDWISWVSTVSNCHSLGYDETDIVLLQVLGIRVLRIHILNISNL